MEITRTSAALSQDYHKERRQTPPRTSPKADAQTHGQTHGRRADEPRLEMRELPTKGRVDLLTQFAARWKCLFRRGATNEGARVYPVVARSAERKIYITLVIYFSPQRKRAQVAELSQTNTALLKQKVLESKLSRTSRTGLTAFRAFSATFPENISQTKSALLKQPRPLQPQRGIFP